MDNRINKTVTVTTSYSVKFTEDQLIRILRKAAGAPNYARVEFDIAGDGFLRDDAVEVSWQDKGVTNVFPGEKAL